MHDLRSKIGVAMPWWRHAIDRPSPQFGLFKIGSQFPNNSGLTEMVRSDGTPVPSDLKFYGDGNIKFAEFDWSLFVTARSGLIIEIELTYAAGIETEAKRVFIFTSNRCLGLWGRNQPSKPGPLIAPYWPTVDGVLILELHPLAVVLRSVLNAK